MGQRLYDDRSGQPERPLRAAEYVRMSTDHQKYSTENQSDAIKQYAEARGIEIVRTYADAGKSGLKIEGRDALRQLIEDVQSGNTDFTLVLVYDVSRWGRFQDADESAYYEYICRRAGIAVEYCAEQFDNDGSPISTIVKGVKRAMAGEYSRELSTKVFAGQGRLIEKGYRQGGPAGFGLRRTLIDEHGVINSDFLGAFGQRIAEAIGSPAHLSSETGAAMWLSRHGRDVGFRNGDWPEPLASQLDAGAKTLGICALYLGAERKVRHLDLPPRRARSTLNLNYCAACQASPRWGFCQLPQCPHAPSDLFAVQSVPSSQVSS